MGTTSERVSFDTDPPWDMIFNLRLQAAGVITHIDNSVSQYFSRESDDSKRETVLSQHRL